MENSVFLNKTIKFKKNIKNVFCVKNLQELQENVNILNVINIFMLNVQESPNINFMKISKQTNVL